MKYPGGKGSAGTYKKIINLIPPHDLYIETHLGGGNIMERKKPAARSIAVDRDAVPLDAWRQAWPDRHDVSLIMGSCHDVLRDHQFTGREFVYADPPYVMSTRTSGPLYRFEYDDADHVELLTILRGLPCPVMLSGYRCDLYDQLLHDWRRIDFMAATRGGPRMESLWLNYEPPAVPADLSHVGEDFRARERLKRKKQRWLARLKAMEPAERAVILEALQAIAAEGERIASPAVASPAEGLVATPEIAIRDLLAVSGEGSSCAGSIAVNGEPAGSAQMAMRYQ